MALEYASVQIVRKSARNLGTDKRGWKGTAMHRSLDVFKDALFWGIMAFGVSPIVFGGALLVWLH